MKKEEVLVAFVYEKEVRKKEIIRGVAISMDKVLVAGEDGIGIYKFDRVYDSNFVIVNLDQDAKDYLEGGKESLIDIVLGINRKPITKHLEYFRKKKKQLRAKDISAGRENRLIKYRLELAKQLADAGYQNIEELVL